MDAEVVDRPRYEPLDDVALRMACGALNVGAPEMMAAQAAMVSLDRLLYCMSQEGAAAIELKLARARGKLGLHSVVHTQAMHGAGYVVCQECREEIAECPHCSKELPKKGDPKWAMALLEKHPEYRQRVELGPLHQDFQAAAEMNEREIAAQLTRMLCYPDAITLQALRAAVAKPGPELREVLEAWYTRRVLAGHALEAHNEENETEAQG